jgi:hypothetical protein
LLTAVSCEMQFINPPPIGPKGDFSSNPVYVVGSTVNVAWTTAEDASRGVSLLLYQLDATDGQWFGDMEYLTRTKAYTSPS